MSSASPGAPTNTADVDWARVYGIDLVYRKDCWQLCGDAHCCNFSRHKSRFRIVGKKPFQELPLLPGEYEYLAQSGGLAQFQDHQHRRTTLALDERRAVTLETIVSHRPGCACDHATRPTICRLYPLFPILDVDGRVCGIEPHFGVYEELEALASMEPACRIDAIPTQQMSLFLELVGCLTPSPLHLFHLHAYRVAKAHLASRLRAQLGDSGKDPFTTFEWQLMRGKLFDTERLRAELSALADRFEARYGDRFRLPAPEVPC
jgi:hypothetical protein